MTRIKIINSKYIGLKEPIFIVAEVGVNHNGDYRLAKKLIIEAKKAGADAVKFQTFKAEKLVSCSAPQAKYQIKNISKKTSQLEMLKKLELSFNQFTKLQEFADKQGILFLSTPFDYDSADFLKSINLPVFKIGSGEITNLPFLEYLADYRKPLILSTGMSTLKEIKKAVDHILRRNKKLILLHCVSNYPANVKSVNLNAMNTLKNEFKLFVGYSDHTMGITIPIAAAALGARVIEKHFTLDKSMTGPDHLASLEPTEFKQMVKSIREVELALGTGKKVPTPEELKISLVARKSIVASRELKPGIMITIDDVEVKRPGTGIPPGDLDKVLGKRVKKKIKAGELITWEKLKR